MASTKRGVAVTFGTFTYSGFIVDSSDRAKQGERLRVEDEDGQYVGDVSGYGIDETMSVELIFLSGASIPEPGDTLTFDGDSDWVCDGIRDRRAKKDVRKVAIDMHRAPAA